MKPISLTIKDLQDKIIKAINESQLPPSIIEPVINSIHGQVAQAAKAEIEQAEKEYKESEGEDHA